MDYTIKQKRLQIAMVFEEFHKKQRFSLSNVNWKGATCNPSSHDLPGECVSRDPFYQEKRPSQR